jgi:hypothetical protein
LLARHEVIADYRRVHRLVAAASSLKRRSGGKSSGLATHVGRYAVARGFGWMFSGSKLPVPRLLDRVLDLLPNGR